MTWRGSTATATRVLPTMIRYPSEPVGRGGDAAGGRAFRRAFSGWGGDPQMVAEDDLLESPLPTHPVGLHHSMLLSHVRTRLLLPGLAKLTDPDPTRVQYPAHRR